MKHGFLQRAIGLSAFSVLVLAPTVQGQTKAEEIDSLMSRFHEQGMFNGAVLVADGREVIYQKGFGYADVTWNVPNTPATKFLIASITKQFTAALVLRLMEIGRIDLERAVTDYLPEYPKTTGDRITIHHLLSHTSGIPHFNRLPQFESALKRNAFAPDSFISVFSSLDLEFEPGTRFAYSNSGYFLLGVIIERVSGRPYAEALREYVLQPLGLDDTGYYTNTQVIARLASGYVRVPGGFERAAYFDSSIPYSAGMLYSTVRDLFTWDQALYDRGPFASRETVDRFLSPHTPFTSSGPSGPDNVIASAAGYGLIFERIRVGPDTLDAVFHDGGIDGFSTMLYRLPERGQTVIIWDNTRGRWTDEITLQLIGLLNRDNIPTRQGLPQPVERQ